MFKSIKIRNALLLTVLYEFFKLVKTKGDLALESHVEMPHESIMFPPEVLSKDEIEFICDYGRLLTLGTSDEDELDRVMRVDIENRTFLNPFKRQRLNAIRESFYAHAAGYAPLVSVEFGRKAIHYLVRPCFQFLEEVITNGLESQMLYFHGIDLDEREKEFRKKQQERHKSFCGNLFKYEEDTRPELADLDEDDEDENPSPSSKEPSMVDILASIRRTLGHPVKKKTEVSKDDDEELMKEWEEMGGTAPHANPNK